MLPKNDAETIVECAGWESKILFRATFPAGYTPMIDTRTPSAVKWGISPQEWKELNA